MDVHAPKPVPPRDACAYDGVAKRQEGVEGSHEMAAFLAGTLATGYSKAFGKSMSAMPADRLRA